MREYYAYYLQHRSSSPSTILSGGRLFQQFTVDVYVAIETCRLNFFRTNQGQLRTELYSGLVDAFTAGETDASAVGKRFILPSTFTAGPRYMQQHYLDAMAMCNNVGYPDYFITFTCNPNWPEIHEALQQQPGEMPSDRPDVLARVFKLKLKELFKDLKERKLFGTIVADIHVIEFQKRGLPHAHILISLAKNDKPNCTEDIDMIISAELPEKDKDPIGFNVVTKHMIHGPCGYVNPQSPCMKDGKCSKHYPKPYVEETTTDENGFIKYRRRRCNNSIEVHGYLIDNRWVVPYNRDLSVKYDAHINIERCAQKKVIKYLHKYMHKGPDRASFVIEPIQGNVDSGETSQEVETINEIAQYQDGRYISSIEACWRLFEFEITQRHPSVVMVQFHLPDEQFVVFNDNNSLHNVVSHASRQTSMLLSWFDLNRSSISARQYTYNQIPSHFVWNRTSKIWSPRKSGSCIGRLPYAHPNCGERYYLRLLLTCVKGAQSYEELRTYEGTVHPSFHEACLARGLLNDDNEWEQAMNEASQWATAKQLRKLFCTILLFNSVSQPNVLWDKFWKDLTEDIDHRLRQQQGHLSQISNQSLQNMGLLELDNMLKTLGKSLVDFPSMPKPVVNNEAHVTNRLILEQLQYNVDEERVKLDQLLPSLNEDQMNVYMTIVNAYESNTPGTYFVYGSGGTGKTHLYRTLVSFFRTKKCIVLSVASSGIAALLLPLGKTAHTTFKIPIDIKENSMCTVSKTSNVAKLLEETTLIIWDEVPMIHRYAFEALDRTLRDICNTDTEFGGKLIIFGGDFRQVLPVVPKGSRNDIITSSICNSPIWHRCRLMTLKINMRLCHSPSTSTDYQEVKEFSEWILKVGNGQIRGQSMTEGAEPNWIEIPDHFLITNDDNGLSNLIDFVYPCVSERYVETDYLQQRCILAPTNIDVDELNALILDKLPGDVQSYYSSDSVSHDSTSEVTFGIQPTELLEGFNISGFPANCLNLKIGTPVVLLRNLDPSTGLCNGTRLIVQKLGRKVVECRIINGNHIGETVMIPRIDLTAPKNETPFVLKRRQFPLKPAFAMTINKSQGQTLDTVGIYLPKPVFSHGQLYVAISRVTSPRGLKMLICNRQGVPYNVTKNVVFKEVFTAIQHE